MPNYLTKEEIRQWRGSLEKITLEEFAARLGKKVEEKKEEMLTNPTCNLTSIAMPMPAPFTTLMPTQGKNRG